MRLDFLTPEFVDNIPEQSELKEGIIYISRKYETAIHLCACGCGMQTVTPFGAGGWKLTVDGDKVSLSPSIGNWNFPCKSHYFFRENKIVWC